VQDRSPRPRVFDAHHRGRSNSRLLLFLYICVSLPGLCLEGLSAQVTSEVPEPAAVEAGREVYALACIQCHGPNQALIQRKPADGWRRTIYSMIGRGAPVLPDEIEPLTAYLTSMYGPTSLPPNLGGTTGDVDAIPPGGETVVAACGACHAVNLVFGSRKSQSQWRDTVEQMRSLGASVTELEQQAIVSYLTEYFGPE
jgi:mono/diheme cytochrome c family protein